MGAKAFGLCENCGKLAEPRSDGFPSTRCAELPDCFCEALCAACFCMQAEHL